jgi:hypothetical protein
MGILEPIAVYYLAIFVGFIPTEAKTITCIAEYESSFAPTAVNQNKNGSFDIGLMQINTVWHDASDVCYHFDKYEGLFNPVNNLRCAKHVYDKQGFEAWYGYQYNKDECDNNYKIKGLEW